MSEELEIIVKDNIKYFVMQLLRLGLFKSSVFRFFNYVNEATQIVCRYVDCDCGAVLNLTYCDHHEIDDYLFQLDKFLKEG